MVVVANHCPAGMTQFRSLASASAAAAVVAQSLTHITSHMRRAALTLNVNSDSCVEINERKSGGGDCDRSRCVLTANDGSEMDCFFVLKNLAVIKRSNENHGR
jgi:hypothetical protein